MSTNVVDLALKMYYSDSIPSNLCWQRILRMLSPMVHLGAVEFANSSAKAQAMELIKKFHVMHIMPYDKYHDVYFLRHGLILTISDHFMNVGYYNLVRDLDTPAKNKLSSALLSTDADYAHSYLAMAMPHALDAWFDCAPVHSIARTALVGLLKPCKSRNSHVFADSDQRRDVIMIMQDLAPMCAFDLETSMLMVWPDASWVKISQHEVHWSMQQHHIQARDLNMQQQQQLIQAIVEHGHANRDVMACKKILDKQAQLQTITENRGLTRSHMIELLSKYYGCHDQFMIARLRAILHRPSHDQEPDCITHAVRHQ